MAKRREGARRSSTITVNGEVLAQFRKIAGFNSQTDLAIAADISEKTVQRAENGEGIRPAAVAAISLAIKVPIQELVQPPLTPITPPPASPTANRQIVTIRMDFPEGAISVEFPVDAWGQHGFHCLRLLCGLRHGIEDPQAQLGSLTLSGRLRKSDTIRIARAVIRGQLGCLSIQSITIGGVGRIYCLPPSHGRRRPMAFPSSILSDTFPTKTSNPSADGRFSITDAGFALHSLGLRKVDAPIAQTEFAALLERTVIESVATESITSVVDRAAIRSRMMSLVIRINDMCLKERWAIVSPTTGLASRLTTISIDAEEVFALEAIDTNATSDYTVDIIAMLPFRLIALPRNASPS